MTQRNTTVFRFKLDDTLLNYMNDFAVLHKDDDRADFKEAWGLWKDSDTIHSLIQKEDERLRELGYTGDIEKKIYTSVRYYLRNKAKNGGLKKKQETTDSKTNSLDKKELRKVAKRDHYINISRAILKNMDSFIQTQINENRSEKPHVYYTEFLEEHSESIQSELERLKTVTYYNEDSQRDISLTNEMIWNKFKKTFKNRYFLKIK
jgi:hypothetical protein